MVDKYRYDTRERKAMAKRHKRNQRRKRIARVTYQAGVVAIGTVALCAYILYGMATAWGD